MHSGITRRGLLRGVAAAAGVAGVSLTAGCDLLGSSKPATQALPHPLDGLLHETVALGDAYDVAIAEVPALATILTGPRDAHRTHARALAQAISAPTPKPAGSPTAGAGGSRETALATLVTAEKAGRDAALAACLTTANRLAPLLGSIAAARACHLEVLR